MTDQISSTAKTNKGSLRFFIALFLISMALNVFLFLRYAKNAASPEDQKAMIALLEQSRFQADSLRTALNATANQLEETLNQNLALVDENSIQKADIEAKLQELQSTRLRVNELINSGGSQVASASGMADLVAADAKIKALQEENTKYKKELDETLKLYSIARNAVDQYSIDAQVYMLSRDSLQEQNGILNRSLSGAKQLQLSELNISPLREKGGDTEDTYKASKVSKLKISFKLRASDLIPKGDKDIRLRIIGTSGEVLANDIDQLTNSDELYSTSQKIEYDGQEQVVTIFFSQDAKYKAGSHRLEILHEGILLNKQSFQLF